MVKGIDLHSHLEGSCPLPVLNNIRARRGDSALIVPSSFDGVGDFATRGFHGFARTLRNGSDFEEATRAWLNSQAKSGVVYSEFRVSVHNHVGKGHEPMLSIIRGLKDGIRQAYWQSGIMGACILEGTRKYPNNLHEVLKWVRRSIDRDSIVGFGIGGTEKDNDLAEFGELFDTCERYNIPVSLHAGENGSLDNVVTAANTDCVKRVGHALALGGAPDAVVDKFASTEKLVEVCLTGNGRLGYVGPSDGHPAKRFYEHAIPLNFGVDDATIFETDFQRELMTAGSILGVGERELAEINRASVEHAFCSEDKKKRILQAL
jgi:adenosine deaminase